MYQHDFAGQHGRVKQPSKQLLLGRGSWPSPPSEAALLIKRVGVSVCLSIDMRALSDNKMD
jgi:hypothetical protein